MSLRRKRFLRLEKLHRRDVFAALVFTPVSDGVDDAYHVSSDGLNYRIFDRIAGEVAAMSPVASTNSIRINGSSDSDRVTIDVSEYPINVPITINGGDHSSAMRRSVIDVNGKRVVTNADLGDRVQVLHQVEADSISDGQGSNIQIDDRSLVSDRVNVRYFNVESLLVKTGSGDDTVKVNDTRARGFASIETGGGDDRVEVVDTGGASILEVDLGDSDNVDRDVSEQFVIRQTGNRSSVLISAENSLDGRVQNTGVAAGVSIATVLSDGVVATSPEGRLQGSRLGVSNIEIDSTGIRSAVSVFTFDTTSIQVGGTGGGSQTLLEFDTMGIGRPWNVDLFDRPSSSMPISTLDIVGDVTVRSIGEPGLTNVRLLDRTSVDQVYQGFRNEEGGETLQRQGLGDITFDQISSVDLTLGSGNDRVVLEGALNVGTLDTGGGDDFVQTIGGRVIKLGAGNDELLFSDITTRGDTRVFAGSGADLITHRVISFDLASYEYDLGPGRDIINIQLVENTLDMLVSIIGNSSQDTVNIGPAADGTRENPFGTPYSGPGPGESPFEHSLVRFIDSV